MAERAALQITAGGAVAGGAPATSRPPTEMTSWSSLQLPHSLAAAGLRSPSWVAPRRDAARPACRRMQRRDVQPGDLRRPPPPIGRRPSPGLRGEAPHSTRAARAITGAGEAQFIERVQRQVRRRTDRDAAQLRTAEAIGGAGASPSAMRIPMADGGDPVRRRVAGAWRRAPPAAGWSRHWRPSHRRRGRPARPLPPARKPGRCRRRGADCCRGNGSRRRGRGPAGRCPAALKWMPCASQVPGRSQPHDPPGSPAANSRSAAGRTRPRPAVSARWVCSRTCRAARPGWRSAA